jgi:hypothetical protein
MRAPFYVFHLRVCFETLKTNSQRPMTARVYNGPIYYVKKKAGYFIADLAGCKKKPAV